MQEQVRAKLRSVLAAVLKPVHCNGCDEWLCTPVAGEEQAYHDRVLNAIVSALENEPMPKGRVPQDQ